MLRANLSKLKRGIIRIFRKDCFDPRTKEQYEEFINKEKQRRKNLQKEKATAKKKEEVSTASTSNTEPSKTGEKVAPTETDSETEEVSATADLHSGATKADVQAAMKKQWQTAIVIGLKCALAVTTQKNFQT